MSRAPWCLGTLTLFRSWAPILHQWRWLTSKGGSNPVCWHKCAFAGATFTAVKEVRPQVWCKGLSLSADVCNPKPRREERRKCLTACLWVSLHFLLRGFHSVCEWLPHLLVENLLWEGSPFHHHATPRLAAASAWGCTDFWIYMKKTKPLYIES